MNTFSKFVRVLFTIFGAIAFLCCVLLLLGWLVFDWSRSEQDKSFEVSFKSIRVGSTESEVFDLLGFPESSGKEFYLSQSGGYEKEYAEAAASSSVRYVFWHRELDLTYAIGFDKYGRVSSLASFQAMANPSLTGSTKPKRTSCSTDFHASFRYKV